MNIDLRPLALTLLISPVWAQVPADIGMRMDDLFRPWDSVDLPGCAVGVAENGLTVFQRAYGMADLEWGIPNTPETIFEGGSVSKQFTAAAVVLLVLDEVISLDDDVRQYIPELPDYGDTITVRHLLNHTSGLRDWGSVAAISGWGRDRRAHTHADVLEILSRQTALNYPPGAAYSYTNSGYNLMAVLVNRASGLPFAEFSQQRIFQPLGLENTRWRDDFRRIVKGRSSSYNVNGDGEVEINRPVENVHGNGGILTTVSDLLRWNQALTEERFGPGFTELMLERGVLNDGTETGYAAGLQFSAQSGLTAIQHTGSTAGYRAYTGRIPEAGLAWALLCNASNGLNRDTGQGMVRMLLGESAPPLPEPEPAPVAQAQLQSLAGLYRERASNRSMVVTLQDDKLVSQSTEWIPLSDTEFRIGPQGVTMVLQPGRRPAFRVDGWQNTLRYWQQVDAWSPTTAELSEFVGVYRSDDADTTFVVGMEEAGLVIKRRMDYSQALEPSYQDGFNAGDMPLWFHRDGAGEVVQLSVSNGRVYDMRFDRVE